MLTRTFLSLSFFEAFMSIVIRYWCKERPSRIPLKGGWSHKHLPHNAFSTTRQQSLLLCKKVPGKAVFLGHPNKNHWSFFKQTGGQYWDTKKVSPKRKSKFTKALASNICNFLRQATFVFTWRNLVWRGRLLPPAFWYRTAGPLPLKPFRMLSSICCESSIWPRGWNVTFQSRRRVLRARTVKPFPPRTLRRIETGWSDQFLPLTQIYSVCFWYKITH